MKTWLKSNPAESLYASILTLAELRRGIELLSSGRRRADLELWLNEALPESLDPERVLPVTKTIGYRWAVFSARMQLAGKQIDVIDGLLAATAIEHNLTLATRNVRDFEGAGAIIFNPWNA